MSPHVLILGAGLSGLTLAQCLRKANISFEIFERDENMHSRGGGWAIAVHTILEDLKASMPSDVPPLESSNHLLPLEIPPQICFYDGGPKRAVVESSCEKPIIRADRQRLRELLATGINVEWNKSAVRISQTNDRVQIEFSDGRVAEGDVLVGADGVNSVVRKHVMPASELQYLPAGVVNGEVTLTSDQFKRQLKLAHSAYVAANASDAYHLYVGLSHVLPDSSGEEEHRARYYWFLNYYDPEATQQPYWTAKASKQDMRDFALQKTAGLDPKFREILDLTPVDGIKTPPLVFRDLQLEDNCIPNGRISLIGDAAHPMAPFRGEGGKHAFEDALRLSRVLIQSDKTAIPSLLKGYEAEMLPRGRDAARRSRAVLDPEEEVDRSMAVAWGQQLQFKVS